MSAKARVYRQSATWHVLACKANKHLTGRLSVEIELYPPTRHKIDIDNRIKALLDVMQHAGVNQDDSQIDRILIERREIEKGGAVVAKITTLEFSGGVFCRPLERIVMQRTTNKEMT